MFNSQTFYQHLFYINIEFLLELLSKQREPPLYNIVYYRYEGYTEFSVTSVHRGNLGVG